MEVSLELFNRLLIAYRSAILLSYKVWQRKLCNYRSLVRLFSRHFLLQFSHFPCNCIVKVQREREKNANAFEIVYMLTSPVGARIFHVAKIKLRGLCNQPSRDNSKNSNNNNCNCKTPQMKQKKQKQLRPNRSWNRCLRDQTNDSI